MHIQKQIPIADQVTQILHNRIQNGEYLPGQKIPSEQSIAQELRISRGSVRSALAILATQGYVKRKHGDGTYVNLIDDDHNSFMYAIWEFIKLIESSGRKASIKPISFYKKDASKVEANFLEIKEGEEIAIAERLFFADEKPIIYSINYSPTSIFKSNIEIPDVKYGIHEFLDEYSNYKITSADVSISPVLPETDVMNFLMIDKFTPILLFEETFRGANRSPLIFAKNYYCDKKLNLKDISPWFSIG